MCAQMLMHAIAHGGVRTHVRESALKVDSGRKIPCRTGESNLRQRCAGPMLYQLSYIPTSYGDILRAECTPSLYVLIINGKRSFQFSLLKEESWIRVLISLFQVPCDLSIFPCDCGWRGLLYMSLIWSRSYNALTAPRN